MAKSQISGMHPAPGHSRQGPNVFDDVPRVLKTTHETSRFQDLKVEDPFEEYHCEG